LGKPAAVFSVFSCLQTVTARLQHMVAAGAQALVMAQVWHIRTAQVLAVGAQPFVFPVLQLIWSQRARVAVADGKGAARPVVELLACLVPER
jgi:hypothetical protein